MRARPLPAVFVLIVIISALAGCIATESEPADPDDGPTDGNPQVADEGDVIVREHVLHVPYYVHRSGEPTVTSQNMEETNWELDVPTGVTEVRASAEWDPSTPSAEDQGLMIHTGTKEDWGPLVVEPTTGTSPIGTAWAAIPEEADTLVIMCHAYSSGPQQPVGIEFDQETGLTVEFR